MKITKILKDLLVQTRLMFLRLIIFVEKLTSRVFWAIFRDFNTISPTCQKEKWENRRRWYVRISVWEDCFRDAAIRSVGYWRHNSILIIYIILWWFITRPVMLSYRLKLTYRLQNIGNDSDEMSFIIFRQATKNLKNKKGY